MKEEAREERKTGGRKDGGEEGRNEEVGQERKTGTKDGRMEGRKAGRAEGRQEERKKGGPRRKEIKDESWKGQEKKRMQRMQEMEELFGEKTGYHLFSLHYQRSHHQNHPVITTWLFTYSYLPDL